MKKIKRILLGIILIALIYSEMKILAPKRLQVNLESFSSSVVPESFDGIRIGVISDIFDNYSNLEKTIEIIQSHQPDLIILAGYQSEDTDELKALLKSINAPLGKFAALAPTDHSEFLMDAGFNVLENKETPIYNRGGQPIYLTGLVNESLSTDHDTLKVHFAHDPSFAINGDLNIAGKTQGGLINLPFIGSLSYSKLASKRSDLDGKTFIPSSGIGTQKPGLRLLSNPKITIIKLNRS